MIKKSEIGRKIKEFGEKKFSSIAELSRQLGLKNRQDVYSYISGRSYPGGEVLIKLAELGCDLNWLLTETEQPTANMFNESRTEFKTATVNEPLEKYFEQNKTPGKVPDTTMIVLEHLYKELEQIKKTLSKLACQQNREE